MSHDSMTICVTASIAMSFAALVLSGLAIVRAHIRDLNAPAIGGFYWPLVLTIRASTASWNPNYAAKGLGCPDSKQG